MAGSAQPLHVAPESAPDHAQTAWDDAVGDWPGSRTGSALRSYSDAVNARLLRGWLPELDGRRVLKTDLFDEAVSDGLVPELQRAGASVLGVDLSPVTIAAARARHPDLAAESGDVRRLRFPGASFDVVVSNSTLDHFASSRELEVALAELHRVLRPGGSLLITLDNGANPLVALRNALPAAALRRLGLTHYYLGATCGPRRLAKLLRASGFEVERRGAVMHFPRVIVRLLAAVLGRRAAGRGLLLRFEALERTPFRYLTGQFVAALAVKRRS